ncbi:MAG: hypothetical protein JO341_00320 [Gammaproteobacteria bacterium]|nr:hypothetical protein [Gammaproteobacteria bacterium]MBV9619443.1 hypothetical protein [Gammaproteobacteria bacterium]
MNYDWIGAASGLVLLTSLGAQCWKQWREGTTRGVSRLFFFGQIITSVGFVIYSALLHNWVFIATNIAILCSAIVGELILWWNRRRKPSLASTQAKAQGSA